MQDLAWSYSQIIKQYEEKIANFSDYDAVAIGPGLSKRKENIELIDELMKNYQGTLVIDADGINAIAADGDAEKIKVVFSYSSHHAQ